MPTDNETPLAEVTITNPGTGWTRQGWKVEPSCGCLLCKDLRDQHAKIYALLGLPVPCWEELKELDHHDLGSGGPTIIECSTCSRENDTTAPCCWWCGGKVR